MVVTREQIEGEITERMKQKGMRDHRRWTRCSRGPRRGLGERREK